MSKHIAYIKSKEDGHNEIVVKDILPNDEYLVIKDCNTIIGKFNSFCDYYYMLKKSLEECINFLKKIQNKKYLIVNQLQKHETLMELNRLFINFLNIFNNYLSYYLVDGGEFFDKDSEEYKKIKQLQNDFFDKYFEYRLLYNLRHYSDHYKIPITRVSNNTTDKVKKYYITLESLLSWHGLKSSIKKDILSLDKDIDVLDLLNKSKTLVNEIHSKLCMIDEHDVLFSYSYLKKYLKLNEFPCIVDIDENKKESDGKFSIEPLFDELTIVGYNIHNAGFGAIASYKKDSGFFVYDPYNLMFTKEEKEKMGLD